MGDALGRFVSLVPLAACTKLRKLDLRGGTPFLRNQVPGLQLAELADLPTVEPEGLVHELQPSMPSNMQMTAANTLCDLAAAGAEAAIIASGAIPALVRLQESSAWAYVRQAATRALEYLPHSEAGD
jgi:hypothetical protein